MRFGSIFVAASIGAGITMAASAARADGLFVTLKDHTGAVMGARVAAAAFDASSTTPANASGAVGQARYKPAHVEIDDWGKLFASSARAIVSGEQLSAVVEFTAPDAGGAEQVYLVATFNDVRLTDWYASWDGAAKVGVHKLNWVYSAVNYAAPPAPPAPAGGRVALRPLVRPMPSSLPVVTRAMARVRPIGTAALHVEEAYLSSAAIPNEGAHTHLNAVSVNVSMPVSATGASGKLTIGSVDVTKHPGAATPALQQASAQGKNLGTVELDFVQHAPTEAQAFVLKLENAIVKAEKVGAASAAATEQTSFVAQKLELLDKATGVTVIF